MSLSKLKTAAEVSKMLMDAAISAVKETGLSERATAKRFGIQHMSMRRRFQNLHPNRSGGQLKFSQVVEKDSVDFLLSCSDEGVPLDRSHCVRLFSQIAIELGKRIPPDIVSRFL